MRFTVLALFFSCTSSESNEATETVVEEETECVNSLPVDRLPGDRITDYGDLPPKREDALAMVLSETGLYSDIVSKEIAPAVNYFRPKYELWSDGEEKSRWVYLPECETIDSSDMNQWSFPVGTRFWKEFRRDGRRIETRLIERIGSGPRDFAYASYMWNEDETEAERVPESGRKDVKNTTHDIPSKSECLQCHGSYSFGGGLPSRGLGYSALLLNHDGEGQRLDDLIAADRLSHPPTEDIAFPGDSLTQDALGYLHINCGSCHNDSVDTLPQFDFNLRVAVGLDSVEETGTWQTAVAVDTQIFKDQHVDQRIVPGSPDRSAILYRMHQRGNTAQMPPVASEQIDEEGIALIEEWIEALQ